MHGQPDDTAPGVYTIRVTVTDDDGGFAKRDAGRRLRPERWPRDRRRLDQLAARGVSGRSRTDGQGELRLRRQVPEGSDDPDGQTEFQFQTGNLNFHSASYQWLVVTATTKAQFKGTGTINGVSGYSFMLTAWEATPTSSG